MSGRDRVLEGATAVTLGEPEPGGPAADGIVPDSEIVISGDRIVAVRPLAARARPGSEVIDARGRVALPGLVNGHLHSEFLLLKGLLEDRRLAEWDASPDFTRAWAWVRDPANVAHVATAYRASYLQSVLGGTTFVAEFNCADAATPASVAAMAEAGLRGLPTLDLARRRLHPQIERGGCLYAMDDEEELTEAELERARVLLAENQGGVLTMHAAETVERMALIRARLGQTTVELLHARGLLGPHLVLSHAIHVTAAEIELLARSSTRVIASPTAEMKLADGAGPFAEMLAAGIPVGLGTDAAVCNNGCDMFGEMKALALEQKLTRGAAAVTAAQALRMATVNGAIVFGGGSERGTLEAGKLADLVLVDARSARMTPLIHNSRHSNVVANLVYAASAADVTDVLVGGEFIVRARRHARMDEAAVLGALQESALRLHRALA